MVIVAQGAERAAAAPARRISIPSSPPRTCTTTRPAPHACLNPRAVSRTCRAASESWTAHKIVSVMAAPPSSTQAPSERGLPRPQPTSHHLVAFARLTVRLLGGSGPNPESDPTFRLTADLPSARFRWISTKAGHYESFYIADTLTPRGAWIRYTILKRPDRLPRGSLWCTLWSGAEPPRAQKATLQPHELSAGPGELVRIGAGD